MAASCVNLDGQLNVLTVMNVKKKGGFLNLQNKTVAIQPGIYNANLKINNESSFTLRLKADKEEESDIIIPINSEKSFDLPANGLIKIAGADISQPFDISGTIQTEITNSDIVRGIEQCTEYRTERRCEKICNNTDASGREEPRGEGRGDGPRGPEHRPDVGGPAPRPVPHCDIVCRDVSIPLYGDRDYEYHDRYTARTATIELRAVSAEDKLANMIARGTESDRIRDYTGVCRLH